MAGKKKQGLSVYALVSFDRCIEAARWSRVGAAEVNPDGSIDIRLTCWPTNARKLQIRKAGKPNPKDTDQQSSSDEY